MTATTKFVARPLRGEIVPVRYVVITSGTVTLIDDRTAATRVARADIHVAMSAIHDAGYITFTA